MSENMLEALIACLCVAAMFLPVWMLTRWLLGPPHTLESVAREILKGLEDGSVVLPDREEPQPRTPATPSRKPRKEK
jgi:hypothetical protein